MNPFGGSSGDDFFGDGGGSDFFGGMGGGMGRGGSMGGPMGGMGGMGGPMRGPMGGGEMGRGGPMGPMGGMSGGNPRRGGYSSFSSYDSSRPEGQQFQEHHEPFGDNAQSGYSHQRAPRSGGGGRGFMFSGLTRADNPFRRQVGGNPAGGYNASAREESSYPHMGREGPQYASRYEEYPRSHGSSRRQPPQQAYYDDESDPDEDPRQRQYYAPQHPYGGGGARGGGDGGRPSGGRLFNYDRFGRRN
ncbi:putative transcription initiation factor TFIID subunit 15b [Alternaria sp. MG1]|jgi:hypothetical protein|uniref:Uncharacterized protein n=2 Tax=Alternaria alternata complex TaxID=187734 RepID=A0A4Q4NQ81_ALTAL|nr:uncharacterized protein J4E82_008616 [Alternaria postmessia]KAH6861451.1 hypothetical protein B0T12DRAFT_391222 [Alternaria alternata]RII21799.1 putative transcription initiation factor TFIID subunit 15b [Alternaria sp. MG1]RYN82355.1 hypothetical protein AA0120_g9875 [Alternaria tenuissima]KAI5372725.1 hypothetical protein J4E82_008616 [Alternaria postmessia]OWY46158.1 hypothetical protein AALT_g2141 [Alternaria alternata]